MGSKREKDKKHICQMPVIVWQNSNGVGRGLRTLENSTFLANRNKYCRIQTSADKRPWYPVFTLAELLYIKFTCRPFHGLPHTGRLPNTHLSFPLRLISQPSYSTLPGNVSEIYHNERSPGLGCACRGIHDHLISSWRRGFYSTFAFGLLILSNSLSRFLIWQLCAECFHSQITFGNVPPACTGEQ